jgi:hypothetical protein
MATTDPFAPVMLAVTLKTGTAVSLPANKGEMSGFKLSLARSTGGVPSVSPVSVLLTREFGPLVPGDTFVLTVEVVDVAGATIAALAPVPIVVPTGVAAGTYVPVTGVTLKWTPVPVVTPPVVL